MIVIKKDTYDRAEEDRVLLPEGRALVEITAVSEEDPDYLEVRYSLLAHEDPAAAGLKGEERFYLSDKAVRRVACLLKRLGMVERGSDDSTLEFDPQDLVAAQVVVDITHEHKERKDGTPYSTHRWGFMQFWAPSDERVSDFMLAIKTRRQPGQAPRAATSRSSTPPARRPAPPVAADEDV